MLETPTSAAIKADFEFKALEGANNYRRGLLKEFSPYLEGDVLEVGAGIGQMTEGVARLPAINRVLALEPEADFCALHRFQYPSHEVVQGTVSDVPPHPWNAILSINVLEHLERDDEELARYVQLLKRRAGYFCVFVPARPEIFAPIDKEFGHFRRYTKAELRDKLLRARFEIVRINYFNLPGYFAWWLNFRLLKKRTFEAAKVRLFDRFVFSATHLLESRVVRPPFGQSLIAVARSADNIAARETQRLCGAESDQKRDV